MPDGPPSAGWSRRISWKPPRSSGSGHSRPASPASRTVADTVLREHPAAAATSVFESPWDLSPRISRYLALFIRHPFLLSVRSSLPHRQKV